MKSFLQFDDLETREGRPWLLALGRGSVLVWVANAPRDYNQQHCTTSADGFRKSLNLIFYKFFLYISAQLAGVDRWRTQIVNVEF